MALEKTTAVKLTGWFVVVLGVALVVSGGVQIVQAVRLHGFDDLRNHFNARTSTFVCGLFLLAMARLTFRFAHALERDAARADEDLALSRNLRREG